MPLKDFLFTSESVSEGHPDKMCDQISDAVLDALIAEDPNSRVALEALVKTGLIVLAGEITSRAHPDFVRIARDTALEIGYNHIDTGFDGNNCAVLFGTSLTSSGHEGRDVQYQQCQPAPAQPAAMAESSEARHRLPAGAEIDRR